MNYNTVHVGIDVHKESFTLYDTDDYILTFDC